MLPDADQHQEACPTHTQIIVDLFVQIQCVYLSLVTVLTLLVILHFYWSSDQSWPGVVATVSQLTPESQMIPKQG